MEFIPTIVGALTIGVLVIFSYAFGKIKSKRKTSHEFAQATRNKIQNKPDMDGSEISVFDERGNAIIQCREIQSIPSKSNNLNSIGALHQVRHLVSDIFKGATGVPNKTIELVFKPDIQQGLADGAYSLMKTKSGEVLADAVNQSGSLVGKGRVVQSGTARQLASGAFQLVSIAVAQSHLADIERSLDQINNGMREISIRLENVDRSNIRGAIDYFRNIAEQMKQFGIPEELSLPKQNVIEGIIRDTYTWRNKLEEDITSLTKQISELKDQDKFGTGKTFEALKSLIEKIRPLLARQELILHLSSLTNFVIAYLDPAQKIFSRIRANDGDWSILIEKFKSTAINKSSELLSNATFNTSDTLRLRNESAKSLSLEQSRIAIEMQKAHAGLMRDLDQSINKMIGSDGAIRIAVAFDENGHIREAALIE
jgi:hypothetical protein